ncbi:MAG: hypothetical protein ACI8RZ_006722 [Myxococcota bacterium]|jgi:hypothetical protein
MGTRMRPNDRGGPLVPMYNSKIAAISKIAEIAADSGLSLE